MGYYRRARMLHKAAQFVAANREGNLPATAAELRLLPGIGNYTAAAIASIAHGEAVAVVDGNVERVLCRLQGWEAVGVPVRPALRHKVDSVANQILDPERPGDFNQALMELGATVCAPRNPQCLTCPLSAGLRHARRAQDASQAAHAQQRSFLRTCGPHRKASQALPIAK